MKIPNPETIMTSISKTENFARTILYPMFAECSEDYADAISSVCASMSLVIDKIVSGDVKLGVKVAEKKAGDDDVGGEKGGRKKLKAGDKEGECQAALDIGHKILEMLEEITDSEACVKEILVGLLCSLAATFDLEQDVIHLLIMGSIGGDD